MAKQENNRMITIEQNEFERLQVRRCVDGWTCETLY